MLTLLLSLMEFLSSISNTLTLSAMIEEERMEEEEGKDMCPRLPTKTALNADSSIN